MIKLTRNTSINILIINNQPRTSRERTLKGWLNNRRNILLFCCRWISDGRVPIGQWPRQTPADGTEVSHLSTQHVLFWVRWIHVLTKYWNTLVWTQILSVLDSQTTIVVYLWLVGWDFNLKMGSWWALPCVTVYTQSFITTRIIQSNIANEHWAFSQSCVWKNFYFGFLYDSCKPFQAMINFVLYFYIPNYYEYSSNKFTFGPNCIAYLNRWCHLELFLTMF